MKNFANVIMAFGIFYGIGAIIALMWDSDITISVFIAPACIIFAGIIVWFLADIRNSLASSKH